jgi:hypothetical protein
VTEATGGAQLIMGPVRSVLCRISDGVRIIWRTRVYLETGRPERAGSTDTFPGWGTAGRNVVRQRRPEESRGIQRRQVGSTRVDRLSWTWSCWP